MPARVVPGLFPPELTVEIRALACELPASLGLPLSRLSVADVARQAERTGLVARISDSTVWRWLHEDAIRPCVNPIYKHITKLTLDNRI